MSLTRREALQLLGGAGTAFFLGDVLRAIAAAPNPDVKIADELFPHFDTEYVVYKIPPTDPLFGNVSQVNIDFLPEPPVGTEGVVRIAGQPLAMFTTGRKGPDNINALMGFAPGVDQKWGLQTPVCPNPEESKDWHNDRYNEVWVAKWALTPDLKITLQENDNPNGEDPGQTLTLTQENFAPENGGLVETMTWIEIPKDNQVRYNASAVATIFKDTYTPAMGEYGAFDVSWKDNGPIRGLGLADGDNSVSLQNPPCASNSGSEWLNDNDINGILVKRTQLGCDQPTDGNPQTVKWSENDDPANPGRILGIDLSAYCGGDPSNSRNEIYLPLVMNQAP